MIDMSTELEEEAEEEARTSEKEEKFEFRYRHSDGEMESLGKFTREDIDRLITIATDNDYEFEIKLED